MRRFSTTREFEKISSKIYKKDKKRFISLRNKMDEILNSPKIDHYKNLKYQFKEYKRVHIDSHFVLIFKFNKKEDEILFFDIEHHDKIYNRN